jgi:hypothetical protein
VNNDRRDNYQSHDSSLAFEFVSDPDAITQKQAPGPLSFDCRGKMRNTSGYTNMNRFRIFYSQQKLEEHRDMFTGVLLHKLGKGKCPRDRPQTLIGEDCDRDSQFG